VDRITRHELKTDHFAEEVSHTLEFLGTHRSQLQKYGVIAAGVLVAAIAIVGYFRYEGTQRQQALQDMYRDLSAMVAPTPLPGIKTYPTPEEKEKAVNKSLSELAARYPRDEEGNIAALYIGSRAMDKGDVATAEKQYKQVAANAGTDLASLANYSLAEIYSAQGKTAEAETLLRALVAKPTVLVSKDQATVSLAQAIAKTKPDEARKLLEPLRTQGGAASRVAINAVAELPAKK